MTRGNVLDDKRRTFRVTMGEAQDDNQGDARLYYAHSFERIENRYKDWKH
jgi:hypothetical protein